MSLLDQAPGFTPEEASTIARELYGLDASASPLGSERDQNFLIDTPDGGRFVLKIANAAEDRAMLEAQNAAMAHAGEHTGLCPAVITASSGTTIAEADGHAVRLLTWIPGRPLGTVKYQAPELLTDLGRALGKLDAALTTFDHPAIHRDFHWDLARGFDVVSQHAHRVAEPALRTTIERMMIDIERRTRPLLPSLRRAAIHNDANDYNILVIAGRDHLSADNARIAGVIDFGDMVHSYLVADPAIAIAYAVLDKPDPLAAAVALVSGYHAELALTEEEIGAVFGLVRLRLALSVCVAAWQMEQRPGDPYLAISQAPILRTLPRIAAIPPAFAEAALRRASGLDAVPRATRVLEWLARTSVADVIPSASIPPGTAILDLSVSSPLVAGDPAANSAALLTVRIARAIDEAGATVGVGRYGEPRLLYSTPLFAGGERRTIHLGIDLFVPAETAVHAPFDGTVHLTADNQLPLDYGPVAILEHRTGDGDPFFTLYGHLSRESLHGLTPGQPIAAGAPFAAVGAPQINGGWTPHLHFQLMVDLLDLGRDFPGVCRASEREVWAAVSPDPNAVLRIAGASFPQVTRDTDTTLAHRRERTGANLSVGYRTPVKVARGWMQYLYDDQGHRLLDAYNNVPHVGHSHPRVVRAVAEQLAVLNTNTRYLHNSLARFAERLTATLPEPLRVCYFVNSGSEANELALRLARAHTGRRAMVVLDAAYHGNTTTLIEISPYKFNGPGGEGAPPWVHVVPIPDVYRGEFRGEAAGASYATQFARTIAGTLGDGPNRLCGFIAETCPSVGGQIIMPPGYLDRVYDYVRAAGGVCIADEVQTAYGRIGIHFYAFEAHGVVPDIVVLGKPIGNGYPLGAVVTTQAIAASFDNGMEFFSTFGGSTASCAAGLAVLDVVQGEGLQRRALEVGERLLAGLRPLRDRHAIVGDVRGSGLFLGVELVRDRLTLEPASSEASYIANRMRAEGILIGIDGPLHNVLKIRPPMPFDQSDADLLVETLDRVLGELAF